ncbi:TonB-dependent receptor plug domain-containing protein [Agaribacter flavus]|uniref:TonB-dependent receptor plug domain-containing protein n=1 Tax=Agaribacter flavus TaxID=1902781 RepID=A0ABV7FNF6_9ALTE
MKKRTLNKVVVALLASYSLVGIAPVNAQEEEAAPDAESFEKIAVVGARGAPRSVSNSPVPIDVLSVEDIEGVAFSDLNDVLRTLVPSYDLSRQPISDGATFIRPATLRGMPTDKTLVLVNGKRRHRSALVQIGGSGTQGPDLATIPSAALGSVEVLRDGAAAQYGSDAIAGVINFQLKENSEGGTFSAEYGQYFEGDGDSITIGANKGLALGQDGFLSVSLEYNDTEATSRGEQYCEPWFCVDPNHPRFDPDASYAELVTPEFIAAAQEMGRRVHGADVVQPWGQPNAEAFRMFVNAGYEISDSMSWYAFTNYTSSEGDGSFFYRFPFNSVLQDIRLEDGSIWNPLQIYPGGFTPRFTGEIEDYSFSTGVKGMTAGELSYDLNARYGYNEIAYTLENTINPSLGDASGTEFHPGTLSNEELQIQADFLYDLNDYTLAFGLSYLDETYDIAEGELESYIDGPYAKADPWNFCTDVDNIADSTPTTAGMAAIANGSTLNCADDNDAVYTVVAVGSNGFPGYSPEFSESYTRDSYAAYVDISGDITDELFMQAAIRFEDYSDFGSEVVYKVAGFYQATEDTGIRASVGTGFRAPTPGQQGTTNVSTRLPNGTPVAVGLFPASSDVAQALGASPLDPETSTNFTFGITSALGDVNITLDYYLIYLEDRVNAVSTLDVSTDPTQGAAFDNFLALQSAGVVGAESIGGVNYFQNAFDTKTSGIDLIVTYSMESDLGDTMFTGSLNYNKTEFDSDPSEFLNAENQFDFENGTPTLRGVFSAKHTYGDFQGLVRVSYYGDYENVESSAADSAIQEFDPEFFVDLEGTYFFTDTLSLAFGVRNVFDNYPDPSEIRGDSCCGRIYRSDSVVDWQGGYYYTKLVAKF